MDRVDDEHATVLLGGGVDLADQLVAVEHRHRPVAPDPLVGWLVHLQLVVEVEQVRHPLAVEDQPVQRGEDRGAPLEVLEVVQEGGVHPPQPADAVDAEVKLGDLEALRGVVKFPVRIKCATLSWNTLQQALDEPAAS